MQTNKKVKSKTSTILTIIIFISVFVSTGWSSICIGSALNTYKNNGKVQFGDNGYVINNPDVTLATATVENSNRTQSCQTQNAQCVASSPISFTPFLSVPSYPIPSVDQSFSGYGNENRDYTYDQTVNNVQKFKTVKVRDFATVTMNVANDIDTFKIKSLKIADYGSELIVNKSSPYEVEIQYAGGSGAGIKYNTELTLNNATSFKTAHVTQGDYSEVNLPDAQTIQAGKWEIAQYATLNIGGTNGDYRFKDGINPSGPKYNSTVNISSANYFYSKGLQIGKLNIKADKIYINGKFVVNEYGEVRINPNNNAKVEMKANNLVDFRYNSKIYLAPGDYYFNNLKIGSNVQIIPTGSGIVRIFVYGSFKDASTSTGMSINKDGNPAHLILYSSNDIKLMGRTKISGLVISEKDVTLAITGASVTGAIISGGNIFVKAGTSVTYDSRVNDTDDRFGNCNSTPPGTDDICYNDLQLSGVCMGFGSCAGGLDCKKTYPLQINSSINNVKIYYNETGMSGSFGGSCGVDPSGTCQTTHNVNFGSFGFFDQATEFDLGNVDQNTNDPDIWTQNTIGMSCISEDRLYVTYEKDGTTYKEKLKKCGQTQEENKFRDFAIRNPEKTRNIRGNVKFIGNTVLKYNYSNPYHYTNAYLNLQYIDTDNNPNTYNSSKALLNMPTGSTIVWAGLYTQGYLKGTISINEIYQKLSEPIHLTIPSIGTILVTHDVIDYALNKLPNYGTYIKYGYSYDTYSEIKQLEGKTASEVNGWITAANIKCYEGTDNSGLGNYGAWTLVVIYKNPNEKLKNISVFDGYKRVSQVANSNIVNISVNGFLTPLHGDINSTLSLFVGEGDKYISGDKLYVNNTAINTSNAFDSSITGVTREPSIVNNQGIDIQNHNISDIISNGDTEATIKLTSTQDTYFPSVVAFATNLYEPRVCYYINTIKDNNNNIIFNNGHFLNGAQIDPTKEYNFNLWIANMKKNSNDNIENARNVQIYVNAPEFNYTSNSTQIKNIGDSAYADITDQQGDDIGEYSNSTKNFTWRLGIGANANQGGDINVANSFDDNSSKAFIKLKGRFSSIEENQTTLDISQFYTFKASFQTNSITVTSENALPIEACVNMDTNADLYIHPKGLFDAWDTFRSINDRNISTKIVNKNFNLIIASINSTNDNTETKEGIDIQYQLYDINNHTGITNWMEYNASSGKDGAYAVKTFKVNSARKNVRVRFKFCAHYNGSGFVLSSLNGCPSADINTSTFSSDNFAIRPYTFKIFGNNQYKRAGEDFNLTIKAVDENNNSISTGVSDYIDSILDYNESTSNLNIASHFYIPSSSDIHQMQTDTGQTNVTTCPYSGSFTVNNTNFLNGEANITLNFSETGILDVNISEKSGNEFAKVDEDDTNDSQRYIKPAIKIYDKNDISKTNILLFIPYKFITTAQYNTTTNQNWLYIADINQSNTTFTTPTMAAYLLYTIKAYNKSGNIVKNYTKTCFPDVDEVNAPRVNGLKLNTTFDLFLDMDLNTTHDANISLYTESNTSNAIWTPQKNKSISSGINYIQEWISPSQFENGVGQAKVYFNIDRNISNAINPIIIAVHDVNTSTSWMSNPGSPKNFNGTLMDINKTFFYGRVHAPDYSAENNTTISNAKIYYEVYCKDCGKSQYPSLGKESIDGVYWYVNTTQDNSKDGNISGFPISLNTTPSGLLTIIQNSISNGVENNTINYIGSSYPYKEKIDINASSWLIYNPYNPNATTNSFYVDYSGVGGWAGIGKTGHTVDLNISTRRSKRIEW